MTLMNEQRLYKMQLSPGLKRFIEQRESPNREGIRLERPSRFQVPTIIQADEG